MFYELLKSFNVAPQSNSVGASEGNQVRIGSLRSEQGHTTEYDDRIIPDTSVLIILSEFTIPAFNTTSG